MGLHPCLGSGVPTGLYYYYFLSPTEIFLSLTDITEGTEFYRFAMVLNVNCH